MVLGAFPMRKSGVSVVGFVRETATHMNPSSGVKFDSTANMEQ